MVTAIIWYNNIKNLGFLGWLKGFTEPIVVMTPMNIISEVAQPLSMAFRHFGNVAGGGVITTIIYAALSTASAAVLNLIARSGWLMGTALIAAAEQTAGRGRMGRSFYSPNETGVYFKNNTARLDDLKIKITNTKVIKVGEPGNEYGYKPVLAIWHEITNLGDDQTNAVKAWAKVFTAKQDTDSELNVGYNPEYDYLDTEMAEISKGEKVKNAIAYELNDLETPVTLIARNGLNGEVIGEQIFDIKELAK